MKKKRILLGLSAFAALGLATVLTSCDAKKFTVRFYDGETELTELAETVTNGYNAEVPTAPTKDGKVFNGWYKDANLTEAYDFGSIVSGDVSIYARWETQMHTVNLYIEKGKLWKTLSVANGSTLKIEGTPTKDYRTFSGVWYTDEKLEKKFNLASSIVAPTNLYAGWTAETVGTTSSFDFDGFATNNGGTGKASTAKFNDGKFTVDAGMRVDNGPLLNTQGKNIVFETVGDGTLSYNVESKSSGNPLILSIYKLALSDDADKVDYSQLTPVHGKEVANGTKLEESIEVEKGFKYVMKTVKSAGYYSLQLVENVEVSAPEKITVTNTKTDFIAGTELDLSGLSVTEVFLNTSTKAISKQTADKNGYTVNTDSVNMNEAGEYTVTVNYTDSDDYGTYPMSATFKVNVYDLADIELGFNATEKLSANTTAGNGVYYNNKVAQVLGKNDKLDLSALTIKAISSKEGYNELYKSTQEFAAENSSLTVSEIDTTTAGEKTVTVTLKLNGVEKTATFKVNVVDTAPAYDLSTNSFYAYVDPAYEGAIGAVTTPTSLGKNANTFTTIQQALDFYADQENLDNFDKVIKLAEGTYSEKLEIELPNLTIRGAATLEDASKYVISWDSLYGIADESGFAQLTDSTQTVAVRESAVNCLIDGVTIQNVYNTIDSYQNVYPGTGERGLAILIQADKFVMHNGRLLGWQDTIETFTGRQCFDHCFVQGCVDYIFGTNSTTVFNECEIHTVKSKTNSKADAASAYVTAYKGNNKDANDAVEIGVVFNKCNFTVEDGFVGYVCIGRSWGAYAAVTVTDSTFSDKFATTADTLIHEGLSVKNETTTLKYFFYGNKKADGTDFVVTEDIEGISHTLTQEQVAALTLDKIYQLENDGVKYNDYWNPTAQTTLITVYDADDHVVALYDINCFVGKTLTQAQINAIKDIIRKLSLDANTQVLEGLFTDKSYEREFTKETQLTDSVAIYAKVKKATVTPITLDYSQANTTNEGWTATLATDKSCYVSPTAGESAVKVSDAEEDGNVKSQYANYIKTSWINTATGNDATFIKTPTIGKEGSEGVREVSVSIYGATTDTSDALSLVIAAYDKNDTLVGSTKVSTFSGKKSGYASLTSGGSATEEFIQVSATADIAYLKISLEGYKFGTTTSSTKAFGISKVTVKYNDVKFEETKATKTDTYAYDYSKIDLSSSDTKTAIVKKNVSKYTEDNWAQKVTPVWYKNGNNYELLETYAQYSALIATATEGKGDNDATAFYDCDKAALTVETFKQGELVKSVTGVTYRSLYQSALGVVEIAKTSGKISFNFKGTGTITFVILSSSSSKSSTFEFVDAAGTKLTAKSQGTSITGTAGAYTTTGTTGGEVNTISFEITEAGVYTLNCTDGTNPIRLAGLTASDTYVAQSNTPAVDDSVNEDTIVSFKGTNYSHYNAVALANAIDSSSAAVELDGITYTGPKSNSAANNWLAFSAGANTITVKVGGACKLYVGYYNATSMTASSVKLGETAVTADHLENRESGETITELRNGQGDVAVYNITAAGTITFTCTGTGNEYIGLFGVDFE